MIEIDGGQKSGSGTIVRDSVPFSILIGEDLRLTNIRAKRGNPGLRHQHLKTLKACAQICGGHVEGASIGAREITFRPGNVICSGKYEWEIETAGSTTMLAMSIIPLALFADGPSSYHITGGLFQDFAPPVFHLKHVLLPTLQRMGIMASLKIVSPGYTPKGGGKIELEIQPVKQLIKNVVLVEQGHVTEINGIALSSFLKERNVSERIANACEEKLQSAGYNPNIEVIYDTKDNPAYQRTAVQPGAALAIWAKTSTGCLIGADIAGAIGRPAELIGKQTAKNLLNDLQTGATVDRYLADQIIPYAALAQGTTTYLIPEITDHIEARIWLVQKILGAKTEITERQLKIEGCGYKR